MSRGHIARFICLVSSVSLWISLNIFKSMVLPYIEYGNCFLAGSDLVSRNKLRVQNKGLKIALNRNHRYSTNILHKEARLATWEVRAQIALTMLMFKYKYHEEFIVTDTMGRLQKQTSLEMVWPILAEPSGTSFLHILDVLILMKNLRKKLNYCLTIVFSLACLVVDHSMWFLDRD